MILIHEHITQQIISLANLITKVRTNHEEILELHNGSMGCDNHYSIMWKATNRVLHSGLLSRGRADFVANRS